MMSRKDKAKADLIENTPLGRVLGQSMARRGIPLDQVSDYILPDEFKFDGWKVVKGKFYKTAKEYKDAQDKHYLRGENVIW